MLHAMQYQMLAAISDFKIVGIAFIGLFLWKLLLSSGPDTIKAVRKFFLILFTVLAFPPYIRFAGKLTDNLTQSFDMNYIFLECFGVAKGSDWANGIIITTFFFAFLSIIFYLWNVEKKASKPKPTDKPFKIEAKIGNLESKK